MRSGMHTNMDVSSSTEFKSDDEIRERNLKHIADISEPSELEYAPLTEEQERWVQTITKQQYKVKKNTNKKIYLQRVVNNECFAEAVLIDETPKFLIANKTGKISIVDDILLPKENKVAMPYLAESYINKPYCFNSQVELNSILMEAEKLNLDHLYGRVKKEWKKYIDADDFHISICTADTIFTYFQDMAGMTHYLFFVGGPGSGKSNNLEVFHFLGYRNMTSSDITAATLYRFYGGREEGVGTICEDEADNVDEDPFKMRIYKNGYTTGRPIFRNDDTVGGRIPTRFFTFGWKALAAERLPDSVIARGFLDRTLVLKCIYGFPQHDIMEVANPMGEKNHIDLLQELEKTRNLLLAYRLLHHNQKFPDIQLRLTGRERQLFKPILRIFNGAEILKELTPVIINYINNRRSANVDNLQAFVYRIVKMLIVNNDSYSLASSAIWEQVHSNLTGGFLYKGTTTFESAEYGQLTQKKVSMICHDVLGGKPDRNMSIRGFIFDPKKLNQLDKIFNIELEVKDMTDMTDMTLFGMDKHLIQPEIEHEITQNKEVLPSENASQAS